MFTAGRPADVRTDPASLLNPSTVDNGVGSLLTAPLRRWPVTLGCAVICAGLAAAAAKEYGQNHWRVEGSLIYSPLAVAEPIRNDYESPNPQTLLTLVKSPRSLDAVIRELDLPVSARSLDRSLKVNKPYNADSVTLQLDWPDPAQGKKIVDRLMAIHADEVVALRQEKVKASLALLRAELVGCERRLAEVRAAAEKLPSGGNMDRVRAEWEQASKDASVLALDLDATRQKLAANAEETVRLAAREKLLTATKEDGVGADEVSAPYRTRKEAVLDALRQEESLLREVEKTLAAKMKEAARHKSLVDRGAMSPLEFDKVSGEVDVLDIRKQNAEAAVQERKRELAERPFRQLQAYRDELARHQEALAVRAAALEKARDEKRKDAVRLADQMATAAAVAKHVERAEADRRAVDTRIAAMERLAGDGVREFVPAQPAAAPELPTASNRKSLAALTFSGLMGVCLVGLVGHARLTGPRAAPRVSTYGLPVLAAAEPARDKADPAAEARQLALRLRGPVHQSGGLVLFTPATAGDCAADVVTQLAHYLALWNQSVLILDARIDRDGCSDLFTRPTEPSAARLPEHSAHGGSELMASAGNDLMPTAGLYHALQAGGTVDGKSAGVRETPLAGVSYLPVGAAFPSPDLLASAAMQRLLVNLSDRFDRILVLGPALTDPVAAEILAGYADAAVVAVRRGTPEAAHVADAVQSVKDAGVAWVGAIVRA